MRHAPSLWLIPATAVSLAILLLAVGLLWAARQWHPDPIVFSSQGPTVQQIQSLGELTVAKVHVADVLTATGEGYKACWIIKGDALLSVDLTKARFDDKHDDQRRATIVLPRPRIISARVNHDATRTYDVQKATWVPWKWGDQGLLRDNAMFHAQRLVERAAKSDDVVSDARPIAEFLIGNLFRSVGWTADVRWDDQPGGLPAEDIKPAASSSDTSSASNGG